MNESKKIESTDEVPSVYLRPHQEEAINIAFKLLVDGKRKVLLQFATGAGKTMVLVELTKRLLKSNIIHKALILTSTRMMAEQMASVFHESIADFVVGNVNHLSGDNHITILTYSKLRAEASITSDFKYDLVICDDAQFTKNNNIKHLLQSLSAMFVGITSPGLTGKDSQGWFNDTPAAFTYSTVDSRKDGYPIQPQKYGLAVEDFLDRLLQQFGYDVKKEPKLGSNSEQIRPDILASSDEQRIILEVKAYRDRNVSLSIINTAIKQMLFYKSININESILIPGENIFCLVLLCEIDCQLKERIFKQFGITIWDIANLLFVCKENYEFSKELNELIYFPIMDVVPEKPYGWMPSQLSLGSKATEPSAEIIAESLEERLRACKEGKEKKASVEYEGICTDIIRFLFESEFTQSSDQHKTGDELFRMDLLCGIKGTSSFWELLISHYNTRFVVFEYKNYSTSLPQNLIYITEKYLFNAALRNVAIIVSRKGFSKNAQIAALGCLKESGKLIIDLTDEDLIKMLHKKADGEEAADFLLWKLECLLMSVGK